jgi:CBS domain-containing protein
MRDEKMHVKNCTLIKPLSCASGTTVMKAAQILREKKQRRILVVDQHEYPVGILSTTDVNNKVAAEGKDSKTIKVDEIMTKPIHLVCDLNDDINEIYRQMVGKQTFFVPVLKDKKLHGILTYAEIVEHAKKVLQNGKN